MNFKNKKVVDELIIDITCVLSYLKRTLQKDYKMINFETIIVYDISLIKSVYPFKEQETVCVRLTGLMDCDWIGDVIESELCKLNKEYKNVEIKTMD